ncbi:MAG: Na+/H+ antiporter subunit E [bacterium]
MKYVTTFVVMLLVYLFLAGFSIDEVILGSIVSAILTILLSKYINFKIDVLLPWRLVKFVVVYIPVFLWKLLLANFDIARRVLTPKIPLNPGIVRIKTHLKGDFGKLTLANSITLTPGTLSIDVEGDSLYVHTVDVQGGNEAENTKLISGSFEKILGGIFQ